MSLENQFFNNQEQQRGDSKAEDSSKPKTRFLWKKKSETDRPSSRFPKIWEAALKQRKKQSSWKQNVGIC